MKKADTQYVDVESDAKTFCDTFLDNFEGQDQRVVAQSAIFIFVSTFANMDPDLKGSMLKSLGLAILEVDPSFMQFSSQNINVH